MEQKKELTSIEKKYPEILENLKKQKKGSNVDNIITSFIKDTLAKIKNKKINELDIGNAFQIGIFADKYGLKMSQKLHDFLLELSDYKIEQAGRLMTISAVEKELNKLKITQ